MRTATKKKKKTNDLKIAGDPSFRLGNTHKDWDYEDPGPVPKRLMDRLVPGFDKTKEEIRRMIKKA